MRASTRLTRAVATLVSPVYRVGLVQCLHPWWAWGPCKTDGRRRCSRCGLIVKC